MNHIRARIPAYIDIYPNVPPEGDFDSLAELLEIAFVKRRTTNPDFKRFTVSRGKRPADGFVLMAEMNDGKFWGVGYLKEDVPELPDWVYTE